MVGPFRPMNILSEHMRNAWRYCGKVADVPDDEQEAEELVARGSFDRSTTKRVTFVGYGTGRSVRYRDIVVRLATRLLRFYA